VKKTNVYADNFNLAPVTNGYIFDDEEFSSNEEFTSSYEPNFSADASGIACYSLRDDYVIYTQDQSQNGLCWAYASTMAVGTTLMMATGQFYDFSEAWVSLARAKKNSSYTFGDGGNAGTFNSIVDEYGLVLESDLQYENANLICDQNIEQYYNYYSQYANKEIMSNLTYVNYDLKNQAMVKNHIYNYGGLSIGMYWNGAVESSGVYEDTKCNYKCPSSCPKRDSGHAITIIGWDDNFTRTYNNKTYTGAWICLNSWGNWAGKDCVLYVFYDDEDIYGSTQGYRYTPNETGLYFNNKIEAGTGYTSYKTNLKGKYYSSTNYTATNSTTKQQNIYFDDDVNITYNYSIPTDAKIDNVSVFFGQENVTVNFDINVDTENSKITLQANNLPTGPYKVLIDYSNATDSAEYVNIIYVMNGSEIERFVINSSSLGVSNNGYVFGFNSYNYAKLQYSFATTKSGGTLGFNASKATYSNYDSQMFSPASITFSGLNAENSTQTFTTTFKSSDNKETILYVTIIFMENSTSQMNTNIYYDLDGGTLNNNNRLIVDKTTGVVLPTPTKIGYDFVGWYYDKECTEVVTDNILLPAKIVVLSNTVDSGEGYKTPNLYAKDYYHRYLNNSTIAFVYAKFALQVPTESTLQVQSLTQSVGSEFTITAKLVHPLAKLFTLTSIEWYKNDVLLSDTANTCELKQTLTEQGAYNYYAKLNVSLDGENAVVTSNTINIVAIKGLNFVPSYNNGVFSWEEVENASEYNVTVYFKSGEDANSQIVSTKTVTSTELRELTLQDQISVENFGAGAYYIGLKATIFLAGNEYQTNEVLSNNVNFYKINFVTYTNNLPYAIVEENTTYNAPTDMVKTGYTFGKWYSDGNKENVFDENTIVVENMTLYADWEMNDIENISDVVGITKTYDGNASQIVLNPSHESGLNNFEYVWYYQKDASSQPVELTGKTENTIGVINCSENGLYYAQIKLTDSDGFSVTNETNKITVKIDKYQTKINIDGIKKEYEYTGSKQTISSGAYAMRDDGSSIDMEISYEIKEPNKRVGLNEFINVPEDKKFTLVVKALGSDNYSSAYKEIEIQVKKAKSDLSAEKQYQNIPYVGKAVKPEYQISNKEQEVVADTDPIYVKKEDGKYVGYNVILTAKESTNYEAATVTIYVIITPAKISIRVDDVSSVVFLGKAKLTYTIIDGEVYNNDDLGITLSADNVDTNKIGVYQIALECSNENYKVAVYEGGYRVTAWPYYAGAIMLGFLGYLLIIMLSKRHYQYEFETNGGNIVSPIDTKDKNAIAIERPEKQGYKFAGWYTDMELTKPFNYKFAKSRGKTLYAKWVKDEESMTLSEELKSAQEIVDQIQEQINPKKEEVVEEKPIQEEQKSVEPKEKTEEEKMQDLINSVTEKPKMSENEMKDFIKKITDK
ncbi:MAG: InlB B-repeat-containing protein, partial [Eubacteriales bacterium]|nr:InlB B-repeat-containing protein [Eubacteriales bacterium]